MSALSEELEKAGRLATDGLADVYLLLTNLGVSGETDKRVRAAFAAKGVRECLVLGREWLSQQILQSPRLRVLVPRVYGLGDLSQILDERAYAQSRRLFASLQADLAKFVPTTAYRRAADALFGQGFVCLLGEPASGKSAIAATLSLFAADHHGVSVAKLQGAADFKRHWNAVEDSKQLFWIDDAFGTIQYQRDYAEAWNGLWPEVSAAIKQGVFIVMTSRDYVYARARLDLKESAFPLLREAQVVIRVQELSPEERREILYNHVKLGEQPKEFRTAIKPHLDFIARHERFLPEVARRLGSPRFTKDLEVTPLGVLGFMARAHDYLLEAIRGLPADEKAALCLIFLRGGVLESPVVATANERALVERIGGTVAGALSALDALDGSIVKRLRTVRGVTWQFQHPTIGEAFVELVLGQEEALEVYLSGAPLDRIMHEVTCGVVELEHVRVVVPSAYYSLLCARLEDARGKERYPDPVLNFLSYRCDAQFLAEYVAMAPRVPDELVDGVISNLDAVAEVRVLMRLHEFRILPEPARKRFVARIADLAVMTPDAGFFALADDGLFVEGEFDGIMERVCSELVPSLQDVLYNWRSNYSRENGSYYDYYEPLRESLRAYADWCSTGARGPEAALLRDAADMAHVWMHDDDEDERPRSQEDRDLLSAVMNAPLAPPESPGLRSRFEDIDD